MHFATSLEHLMAALERIDLRVRAAVAATRRATAEDARFRGLFISEDEVDALVASPLGQPSWNASDSRTSTSLNELRGSIAARATASLDAQVDLRLVRLQRRFGLDDVDVDLLLFCLAPELDLRYERLYAYLQDDVTKKRPSVDLLLTFVASDLAERLASRRRFAPTAPLRRSLLVELNDEGGAASSSLAARSVRLADRVVAHLLGQDDLDEAVRVHARLERATAGVADLVVGRRTARALQAVVDGATTGGSRVVHLHGVPGIGKAEAAAAVCFDLARPLLVVDLERVVDEGIDEFEASWAALVREARLQDAVLYLRGWDVVLVAARARLLETITAELQTVDDLVFVAGQRAWEPAGTARSLPFVGVHLPALDVAQRTRLWRQELETIPQVGGAIDAAVLSGKFRFGPVQIRDAAASARKSETARSDQSMKTPTLQAVHEACRLHSNQQLSRVSRKITPKHRWDDIVLPADRLTMLRDICNHIKYRGRVYGEWGFGEKLAMGKGLAVLFAGPSGTGKTMAADIIAGELGLDLFKIDLASIISKYIGETEKNLGSVFDEAETSNAILFFDEADALFGKRSEVRDSHDRYANVEVGYLLQRIEEYEGVAILASNFRKNMDDAFVRRLHFTVDFPFPGIVERGRIWESVWPSDTPRAASIDAQDLGRRFEMTGGNIRNVALAAAFLAADAGGCVELGHVLRATQREYQKMGKLSDEKSFVVAAA